MDTKINRAKKINNKTSLAFGEPLVYIDRSRRSLWSFNLGASKFKIQFDGLADDEFDGLANKTVPYENVTVQGLLKAYTECIWLQHRYTCMLLSPPESKLDSWQQNRGRNCHKVSGKRKPSIFISIIQDSTANFAPGRWTLCKGATPSRILANI